MAAHLEKSSSSSAASCLRWNKSWFSSRQRWLQLHCGMTTVLPGRPLQEVAEEEAPTQPVRMFCLITIMVNRSQSPHMQQPNCSFFILSVQLELVCTFNTNGVPPWDKYTCSLWDSKCFTWAAPFVLIQGQTDGENFIELNSKCKSSVNRIIPWISRNRVCWTTFLTLCKSSSLTKGSTLRNPDFKFSKRMTSFLANAKVT